MISTLVWAALSATVLDFGRLEEVSSDLASPYLVIAMLNESMHPVAVKIKFHCLKITLRDVLGLIDHVNTTPGCLHMQILSRWLRFAVFKMAAWKR